MMDITVRALKPFPLQFSLSFVERFFQTKRISAFLDSAECLMELDRKPEVKVSSNRIPFHFAVFEEPKT